MNLEKVDSVYVLNLGDTENRLGPDSIAEAATLVREVGAASGPRALVTTATGKFWSNGLDLEWVGGDPARLAEVVSAVQELFALVLEADFPTVAAIQGHAFAAGAMLALAHDARFMREDRGWMCLPEVDIHMVFTSGMNSLVSAKLTPRTAHQAMVFGRRFTAPQAEASGMVDHTASADDLLVAAIEYAAELAGKDPATLAIIKRTLYGPTLDALRSRR